MPHICVSEPVLTNNQMRTLGTIFNEIRMEIKYISFMKVHSKMSFCGHFVQGEMSFKLHQQAQQQYVIWRNGACIISNIASQICSK